MVQYGRKRLFLISIARVLLHKCSFSINISAFYFYRDGKITTQELLNALLKKEGLSREKALALCEVLDMDKDGSLDLDELKMVNKNYIIIYPELLYYPL